MLNYILRCCLCLTAVYLVQCLRSQTAILSTPEFVITFFVQVFFLIVVYRERKKELFSFHANSSYHFIFLCALSLLHF